MIGASSHLFNDEEVGHEIQKWIQSKYDAFRNALPDYQRAKGIAYDELSKHHGHNNYDDAQRHSEWSYRMYKEIGPFTSFSAGVGHEIDGLLSGQQPWNEAIMDLHNNSVGRAAASEGGPIDPYSLITSPANIGVFQY